MEKPAHTERVTLCNGNVLELERDDAGMVELWQHLTAGHQRLAALLNVADCAELGRALERITAHHDTGEIDRRVLEAYAVGRRVLEAYDAAREETLREADCDVDRLPLVLEEERARFRALLERAIAGGDALRTEQHAQHAAGELDRDISGPQHAQHAAELERRARQFLAAWEESGQDDDAGLVAGAAAALREVLARPPTSSGGH